MNAKVIAVINQKGGVGKTTTAFNIGVGLARMGKKVLLIDLDPQGSLTISCGYSQPDELEITTYHVMSAILHAPQKNNPFGINTGDEKNSAPSVSSLDGILQYKECVKTPCSDDEMGRMEEISVDLLPANIELAGMENELLLSTMRDSRRVLADYVNMQRENYDYILIDCLPSLGLLSVNALVAADSALIPLTAAYLPIKGLNTLVKTIGNIKSSFNPELDIEGILITMYDQRSKFSHDTEQLLRSIYNDYVMDTKIPRSCVAEEAAAKEVSIFAYQPKNKKNRVAPAYEALAAEIVSRHEGTAAAVNQ